MIAQSNKRKKYLLKRQEKEQRLILLARRQKIRKIVTLIGIVFVGGTILAGIGYFIFGMTNTSQENSGLPQIEIQPLEYDAGTISMAGGLVKYTYEIQNRGEGDLKIDKIWTSCMCTTARLKVGNKQSPEFGMHNNPPLWSEKITPGETGFLEVTFDPAFHGPKGTGSVVRAIYLSTNDPKNQKAEVRLLANVVS